MEKLGHHLLYGDTDSVVFAWDEKNDGPLPLQLGEHLGDLSDEIKPGEWIGEFVSTGPKSYAYKVLSSTRRVLLNI